MYNIQFNTTQSNQSNQTSQINYYKFGHQTGKNYI